MAIFILFSLFLIAGIIFETQTILNGTKGTSNKLAQHIYTLGLIFFLFDEEAYTIHGLVLLLATLGVITDSLEKSSEITYLKAALQNNTSNNETGNNWDEQAHEARLASITRWDAILSLAILLCLTLPPITWIYLKGFNF